MNLQNPEPKILGVFAFKETELTEKNTQFLSDNILTPCSLNKLIKDKYHRLRQQVVKEQELRKKLEINKFRLNK